MKVIFLTLVDINDLDERGIYQDLLRKFQREKHDVYIVSPTERAQKKKTTLIKKEGYHILKVRTLNIQKANILEKGIGTLLIEYQFLWAIKKYLANKEFDLVLYSTPPVTFNKIINYLKNKNQALTYLLLKDIFPQNAVDLGMLSPKGFLYSYFRKKETKLYSLSDYIGCMSQANVDYVLRHNPQISAGKVEVNPNSIELSEQSDTEEDRGLIRKKYSIPLDSTVFIYGGNIGKPQGIGFLKEVLESRTGDDRAFFIIVGDGTEFSQLKQWYLQKERTNILLLSSLPKKEYHLLVKASDVGLIFLDKRFTIPNFPSRLLSYLEYKMPVIAATDVHTDIGKVLEYSQSGFFVEAGNLSAFNSVIDKCITDADLLALYGNNGYKLLKEQYTVDTSYQKIISKVPTLVS